MDIVSRFCKAESLVMDTIVGTLATEKPCFQLPQHRRIVEFQRVLMCFVESLRSFLKLCPRYVLNLTSAWVGNQKVLKSCKVLINAMESNKSKTG